ncbi:MAG: D-tyrosyl-tRNA(Tyr) deacylase [Flavobacteriales bacterium]|jgi:D-tyrosyl-tRNA(Tyr) deacylase
MKILIQRVLEASVTVDNDCVGQIEQGLLALIGIEKHDDEKILQKMAAKLCQYRVFADNEGKMNLNVMDVGGGILAISQFTLAADTGKGLRPSFSSAASPDNAKILYHQFIHILESKHAPLATGIFAADMKVSLINNGPVTFLLQA